MAEPIRNPHDFDEYGQCRRCLKYSAETALECAVRPRPVVVPLRGPAPPAVHEYIADQLEQMAAAIRSEKMLAQRVLVVVEDADGDIDVHGYGAVRTMLHDIGMLDEGKDYIRICADLEQPEPPKKDA